MNARYYCKVCTYPMVSEEVSREKEIGYCRNCCLQTPCQDSGVAVEVICPEGVRESTEGDEKSFSYTIKQKKTLFYFVVIPVAGMILAALMLCVGLFFFEGIVPVGITVVFGILFGAMSVYLLLMGMIRCRIVVRNGKLEYLRKLGNWSVTRSIPFDRNTSFFFLEGVDCSLQINGGGKSIILTEMLYMEVYRYLFYRLVSFRHSLPEAESSLALPCGLSEYGTPEGNQAFFYKKANWKRAAVYIFVGGVFFVLFIFSYLKMFLSEGGFYRQIEKNGLEHSIMVVAVLFMILVGIFLPALYYLLGHVRMEIRGNVLTHFAGVGRLERKKQYVLSPETRYEMFVKNGVGLLGIVRGKKRSYLSSLMDQGTHRWVYRYLLEKSGEKIRSREDIFSCPDSLRVYETQGDKVVILYKKRKWIDGCFCILGGALFVCIGAFSISMLLVPEIIAETGKSAVQIIGLIMIMSLVIAFGFLGIWKGLFYLWGHVRFEIKGNVLIYSQGIGPFSRRKQYISTLETKYGTAVGVTALVINNGEGKLYLSSLIDQDAQRWIYRYLVNRFSRDV